MIDSNLKPRRPVTPTLIPDRVVRTPLAWWTRLVASHRTRRCMASSTSSVDAAAGAEASACCSPITPDERTGSPQVRRSRAPSALARSSARDRRRTIETERHATLKPVKLRGRRGAANPRARRAWAGAASPGRECGHRRCAHRVVLRQAECGQTSVACRRLEPARRSRRAGSSDSRAAAMRRPASARRPAAGTRRCTAAGRRAGSACGRSNMPPSRWPSL